jgi:hypothetical protein
MNLTSSEYKEYVKTGKLPEQKKPSKLPPFCKSDLQKSLEKSINILTGNFKIKDYSEIIPLSTIPAKKKKKDGNGDKAKAEMELVLQHSGLEYEKEFVFAKPRRFRFDYAIPSIKLAIEYEGIVSGKSRHTSITGYTNDTNKYNIATKNGWSVLRYTALNYKQLSDDLNEISHKFIIKTPNPAMVDANTFIKALSRSYEFTTIANSTKK